MYARAQLAKISAQFLQFLQRGRSVVVYRIKIYPPIIRGGRRRRTLLKIILEESEHKSIVRNLQRLQI